MYSSPDIKSLPKLGSRMGSSVWLCRDFESGDYLTLKVFTCRRVAGVTAQSTNEMTAARHIQDTEYEHPSDRYLRLILRNFAIYGLGGEHRRLLYTCQGMTFMEFRSLLPNRLLNKALLQQTYQLILIGLDLLHQLGVVHTDISPNNILLGAQSSSVFSKIEKAELEHPSSCKALKNRVIYQSQSMPITDGTPVLCGMEWDYKIGIWSIGVMIWDLFEGGRPFYALKKRILDGEQHLAEMVALMGPSP
ncbi:serine/threonine protein kinase [Blastomyces percursus]|uniref:EKC/KEOPS complex subunit BUD32 n=1 Tax=Blastomyces percursus TaxID=1658174 RepID=A0A1J9RKA5_9EURO|nr:serine/threonine protein kinase [Blastomyces percursus]